MVAALIVLALAVGVIDAQKRIIPNWACLCVAAIGIVLQLIRLTPAVSPSIYTALAVLPLTYHVSTSLPSALSCLVLALALLFVGTQLELLVRKIRGESGMGLGDVKYIAAWACVIGWYVLPALAIACLFGAVSALCVHERTFALGPWLSLAFVAVLLILLFFPRAQLLLI